MEKEEFSMKLKQLRNGEKLPENRNDYWSKADIKRLTDMFSDSTGISEIALQLGRTEVSVSCRLMAMGLFGPQSRPRSPNRKDKQGCKCPSCSCTNCPNNGKCQIAPEEMPA